MYDHRRVDENLSEQFAYVHLGGKIKDNFVKGGSNFSVSAKEHQIHVTAGKRWIFLGGLIGRDVSATCITYVRNAADEIIYKFTGWQAGATGGMYPTQSLTPPHAADYQPFLILEDSWYIQFNFSANQGAAAIISAIILEIDDPT